MGARSIFYGISASEKYFFYTFTTLVKGLSEFKINVYGHVHPTPGKYAPNILVLANSFSFARSTRQCGQKLSACAKILGSFPNATLNITRFVSAGLTIVAWADTRIGELPHATILVVCNL